LICVDGYTCIGCGIASSQSQFTTASARPGVKKIIVVITDGENNRGTGNNDMDTAATNAKNHGRSLRCTALGWQANCFSIPDSLIIVVGVSEEVKTAELLRIASGSNGFLNGVPTYYNVTGMKGTPYICWNIWPQQHRFSHFITFHLI
jgi:hypothetical protein